MRHRQAQFAVLIAFMLAAPAAVTCSTGIAEVNLQPNPSQAEIVGHRDGALLVLAGPGTGKTFTLCKYYESLVREGVDAQKIICLTFTRSAADQMKTRVARELKLDRRELGRQFGTYHSLGLRILLKEKDRGNLPFELDEERPVVREGRAKRLVENCLRPGIFYKDARAYIALQKRRFVTPEESLASASSYRDKAMAEIYTEYERRLREDRSVDYESMIFEAYKLLSGKPEILDYYQSKLEYLIVDEFQDTSPGQQKLSALLGSKGKAFVAVGDYFQGIFSFAGGDCSVIRNFGEFFPGHSTRFLAQNYRSTKRIIECFTQAAPASSGASAELLRKLNTENPMGEPPVFKALDSPEKEAQYVFERIAELRSAKNRRRLGDFALLFRTNRQMRFAEDNCIARNWPYRSPGCGFYGRTEVRLALAFLKMLEDPNAFESSRCRCRNGCDQCKDGYRRNWVAQRIARSGLECVRYLVPTLMSKVVESSPMAPYEALPTYKDTRPSVERTLRNFYYLFEDLKQACDGKSVSDQLLTIYEKVDLSGWLRNNEEIDEGDNSRVENILELARAADRFSGRAEFLHHVGQMDRVPRRHDPRGPRGDALTLSTIHSAKGLEWPVVFVCGVTEGVLPHKDGELEEEQRILYVALSRAKSELYVTSAGKPSDFLARNLNSGA